MGSLALVALLVRLGGQYERAELARDYARMVDLDQEMRRLGEAAPEDVAWELAPIRGRNIIRRARGLEELHI